MLTARQRARRARTRPRTDHTIETALAIVRDLARFLADQRGKLDWALADVHDIEAPRGFTGQTLALDQQRGLFRRWAASSDAHPHVIVTKGTKAGRAPASTAYMSHVLDPSGASPRTLRCTRLADLVSTMDPKLVAAAFGMNPGGVMIYLADHIDDGRLPG
jgi:hypothetical protein